MANATGRRRGPGRQRDCPDQDRVDDVGRRARRPGGRQRRAAHDSASCSTSGTASAHSRTSPTPRPAARCWRGSCILAAPAGGGHRANRELLGCRARPRHREQRPFGRQAAAEEARGSTWASPRMAFSPVNVLLTAELPGRRRRRGFPLSRGQIELGRRRTKRASGRLRSVRDRQLPRAALHRESRVPPGRNLQRKDHDAPRRPPAGSGLRYRHRPARAAATGAASTSRLLKKGRLPPESSAD